MISFQNKETRQKRVSKYASGKILDVGFAQSPNKFLSGDVVGYDINEPAQLPPNYSRTIKDDVSKITQHFTSSTFDTIVALEIIEHIENHITFLRDCHGLLKPHGLMVISTPTPFYYRTIFGNIFFHKGTTANKGHVSIYIPRILNHVAQSVGFEVHDVKPATSLYIPLLTWQILYIYSKP